MKTESKSQGTGTNGQGSGPMPSADKTADGALTSVAVTDAYVHDQPWKAIGIGAALGFVLGFALARRV